MGSENKQHKEDPWYHTEDTDDYDGLLTKQHIRGCDIKIRDLKIRVAYDPCTIELADR